MSLQTITNINVDFYDKKYILINAKQLDKSSRFLSVTCYNHGEIFHINSGEHSAYIRYKKADDNSVFNFCDIDRKGNILVELTEQMLASDGICYADLVIVNKGSAEVDVDTGEIIAINNSAILSTMTFCIDVSETAVLNSNIESSYEYNGLNKALEDANAEWSSVIKSAKSWAVGGTGIRDGEDADNAKYYAKQSLSNLNSAIDNCNLSKSYAVGNTGVRINENADNAKYYYEMVKTVADGLNSGFIPMGTISFAELAAAEKATGFSYNINEDFTTDETFREGAGKLYTAGTNVYYTADGHWDCFGGYTTPIATVDEVKSYLGIE